jgi:acetolactate synthase-1/2/3 large subunit
LKMSMIDGGALVGKALANEGVEKAFVLCGGHIMPIFYGMRNAGIEVIDMRHECAAMYAAIGYTRASGKAAAVVTTAGPGVGNTPAGMMEAESLGIPVLQIGGAVAMRMRDAGDLQDMSTLKVMEACSKWARKITSTDRIPEYVSMAFRHAMDSKPGPVYLEIPTDLLFFQVEEEQSYFPVKYRTDAIPYGDPALIESAAELLSNAERPAMVIDDGARFTIGDDAAAVAALSDYLKMPVGITGPSCRGLFGDEYENPLLRTNMMGGADVVLALGCRFDFRLGLGKMIPGDAKVIQVHTDMRQIGFNLSLRISPGPALPTKVAYRSFLMNIGRKGFPSIPGAVQVKSPGFLRKKAGTGLSFATAVKPRFGWGLQRRHPGRARSILTAPTVRSAQGLPWL